MIPKKKNTVEYIVFGIILYLAVIFATMHYSAIMQETPDMDGLTAVMQISAHIKQSPFDVVVDWSAIGMVTMVGLLGVLMVYSDSVRNKHDMAGKEQGSAKWNENIKDYNKKFTDPIGKTTNAPDGKSKNMILSQNIRLSMEGNKTRRNCNICIIGGSGTGKSRFEIKPNLLQANSSYVVTDPKGELLESTGKFLEEQGYAVKVFNTIDFGASWHYNPFHYLHSDSDCLKMINCLIKNTTPAGSSKGDPFWEKSETALLTAICLFLYHCCPEEDQNFGNVMRLLECAEVDEDNPNTTPSALDIMFIILEADAKKEAAEKGIPYIQDLAARQYHIFKMAAGKTAKSILISAGTRLAYFQMPDIASLVATDDIDLTTIGDKKTALFCVISASDSTFNFLVAMMYTQLFDELYMHATAKYHGSLPIHVRFLLDEFANIGQIPEFDKKLATMRSYQISCTIVLQSIGQLKSNYKDDWETILGNCDSKVYLGGDDKSTTEYISGILGKATITAMSHGRSMGRSGSSSKNFQAQARDLMTTGELGLMDNNYEIVMVRSCKPFYDKKYNYPAHPNYKYTADADKKNLYDFRAILKEKAEKQKEMQEQKRRFEAKAAEDREKRNKDFEIVRRNKEMRRKAASKSFAGRECLKPQDAEESEAKNPNQQEVLVDANLPQTEEFDSEYEFRDGIEGYSLEDALADCKQMLVAAESEPVVELSTDDIDGEENDVELEDEFAEIEKEMGANEFIPPEDCNENY